MSVRIGITAAPGRNGDRPAEVLNRAYVDAVVRVGALPLVLPVLDPAYTGTVLDAVDALVLSGGGDVDPRRYGQDPVPEVYGVDERRDEWELALARAALGRGVPVLAVCRGMQVLNVAFGGTLVQDLASITEDDHRVAELRDRVVHHVDVEPVSKLVEVLGAERIGANTLHHQAVCDVGAGLRAVAWAHDGTIEAIESEDARPVLGVQWHPELLVHRTPHRRLFEWVVQEARRAERPRRAEAVAADDGEGAGGVDEGERGVA
jgi:putative glutamine amidotransferase